MVVKEALRLLVMFVDCFLFVTSARSHRNIAENDRRVGHFPIFTNHFNPCGDHGWCELPNACFVKMGTKQYLTTTHCISAGASIKAVKTAEKGKDSRLIDIIHCKANISEVRKGTFVYKEPYYLGNIGHILGDDIWVIYGRLYFMNLHHMLNNVYILFDENDREAVYHKSVISQLYNLLTDNKLEFFSDKSLGNDTRYCYEKLIVGWTTQTYAYSHTSLQMIPITLVQEFRNRALAYASVSDKLNAPICDVLFILKNNSAADHKYGISNVDELVQGLIKYKKCTIKVVQWSGMSLKQQILEIANKRIVVSLPGSDIMNCIFQPINSGMIIPYRCNKKRCEGSNEINLWYSKIPYRRIMLLPPSKYLIWHNSTLKWQLNSFISSITMMANRLHEDVPHVRYSSFKQINDI